MLGIDQRQEVWEARFEASSRDAFRSVGVGSSHDYIREAASAKTTAPALSRWTTSSSATRPHGVEAFA